MADLIEFTVDIEGKDSVLSMLANVREQVPFALAVAINRTAEEVLAEGRRQILANFTVRAPRFDLPPVQLPRAWRATKTRPIATVDLGDDDGGRDGIGARRKKIFTKFEYGGHKTALDPSLPIAIPTKVLRPSDTSVVPRGMYPTNLRLAPRLTPDGTLPSLRKGKVRSLSGATLKSKKQRAELGLQGVGGTFTMKGHDGRVLGVFQRTGQGHRSYRMIWAFRQSIRIPRLTNFAARGTAIIEDRFWQNFEGALELAMRTAR